MKKIEKIDNIKKEIRRIKKVIRRRRQKIDNFEIFI